MSIRRDHACLVAWQYQDTFTENLNSRALHLRSHKISKPGIWSFLIALQCDRRLMYLSISKRHRHLQTISWLWDLRDLRTMALVFLVAWTKSAWCVILFPWWMSLGWPGVWVFENDRKVYEEKIYARDMDRPIHSCYHGYISNLEYGIKHTYKGIMIV